MRVRLLLLAAALLMAAYVPSASAQDDTTLWSASNMTNPNGAGSDLSREPPTGNNAAATCTGCAGGAPYKTTLNEQSPSDYGFEAKPGNAVVTVFVKSWNSLPAPGTEVEAKVSAGGVEIFSGSQTKDVMLGNIVKFTISGSYSGGDIPAGTPLKLETWISDESTGSYNPAAYPRASGSEVWSVQLPVVEKVPAGGGGGENPVEAIVEWYDLTGPVALDFSPEEPLSATYNYNWTTNFTAVDVLASTGVSAGSLSVLLSDDEGIVIVDEFFNQSREFNVTQENLFAGVWSLQLVFDEFVGTHSLDVTAMGVAPVDNGNGNNGNNGNNTQTESSNGNQTANGNGTADEKSPGLTLPMLAVAVGLVVIARRRYS